MSDFIVSNWFKERATLNIQAFNVEGVEFEIMALSESSKEDVKSCISHDEMLSLAANAGISCNRKRIIDDIELAKDIDLLWGLEPLDIDLDPCIKYRVGEKICEISGLNDTLSDMLASEKAADEAAEMARRERLMSIDGDNLGDTSVTLQQLNDDAAAAVA